MSNRTAVDGLVVGCGAGASVAVVGAAHGPNLSTIQSSAPLVGRACPPPLDAAIPEPIM